MLVTTEALLGPKPPQSAYSESYRVLRANLMALQQREPFNSILITSATAREGKTTVAINLATTLALSGKSVIVADTDAVRQGLSRLLGLSGSLGLTDLCMGATDADAVLRATELANLSVVSAGTQTEGNEEFASLPGMGEAIRALRARTGYLILDGTPTIGFGSTLAMAPLVDTVIVIARARREAEIVRQALVSLVEVGANVAGVVVNDILPADSLMTSSYYSYHYTSES